MRAGHRAWHLRLWIACGLAAAAVLALALALRRPSALAPSGGLAPAEVDR